MQWQDSTERLSVLGIVLQLRRCDLELALNYKISVAPHADSHESESEVFAARRYIGTTPAEFGICEAASQQQLPEPLPQQRATRRECRVQENNRASGGRHPFKLLTDLGAISRAGDAATPTPGPSHFIGCGRGNRRRGNVSLAWPEMAS